MKQQQSVRKNEIMSKSEIFFGVYFEKKGQEYVLELLPEDMRFFRDLIHLELRDIIDCRTARKLEKQKSKELFASRRISTAKEFNQRLVKRDIALANYKGPTTPILDAKIDSLLTNFAQYL